MAATLAPRLELEGEGEVKRPLATAVTRLPLQPQAAYLRLLLQSATQASAEVDAIRRVLVPLPHGEVERAVLVPLALAEPVDNPCSRLAVEAHREAQRQLVLLLRTAAMGAPQGGGLVEVAAQQGQVLRLALAQLGQPAPPVELGLPRQGSSAEQVEERAGPLLPAPTFLVPGALEDLEDFRVEEAAPVALRWLMAGPARREETEVKAATLS